MTRDQFAIGTAVLMATEGRGIVVDRWPGGGVVAWDSGRLTAVRPFALSHERARDW